jgi:hypothetical protein
MQAPAYSAPNKDLYSVPFDYPPQFSPNDPAYPPDGQHAFNTIEYRRRLIANFVTCDSQKVHENSDNPDHKTDLQIKLDSPGEDLLAIVLAEMYVLADLAQSVSPQTKVCGDDIRNRTSIVPDLALGVPLCPLDTPNNPSFITAGCIRSQINGILFHYVHPQGKNPGSSDLPCVGTVDLGFADLFGNPSPILTSDYTSHGEWDVEVRDLVRIFELNDRFGYIFSDAGQQAKILSPLTRQHIRDDLLDIRGAPIKESYGLLECGDQESQTGSPDDWADGQTWLDGALDDIGDALKWLLRHLLALPALVVSDAVIKVVNIFTGNPLLDPLPSPLMGALTLTFGRVPETENHRLMIESSRFLTNQIMLAEMASAHPNRHKVEQLQDEVRTWLLKRMSEIAKNEFAEYNARPYQRYSLAALRNLNDFARDKHIIIAAKNLLDLAAIKFAIGSNQGRRLVPFRRRMETVLKVISPAAGFNGLFDFTSGSDSMIAIMQFYTGDTRQTFNNKISSNGTKEMMLAAASYYRPLVSVLDLAIRKPEPYFQRISHHNTVEIYSSMPGVMLMAGGLTTGPTSTLEVFGASAQGTIGPVQLSSKNDWGAALPTTIMFESGRNESSLEAFVRIEGVFNRISKEYWTWDNNSCVYRAFACGINIVIPDVIKNSCAVKQDEPPWLFIKLNSCTEIGLSPQPIYVLSEYRVPCGLEDPKCFSSNTGFIEIVPLTQDVDLSVITSDRKSRLEIEQSTLDQRTTLKGKYLLWSGESIEFDTRASERDWRRTGIEAVNGRKVPNIDEWARAEGSLSAAAGSSTFSFRSPIDGTGLDINMEDWNNPQRMEIP